MIVETFKVKKIENLYVLPMRLLVTATDYSRRSKRDIFFAKYSGSFKLFFSFYDVVNVWCSFFSLRLLY